MEQIQLGEKLNIPRSDGRVHPAVCTAKDLELDSITSEWTEGAIVKGKQVPVRELVEFNHQIFQGENCDPAPATATCPATLNSDMAASPPPSAAGSLIPRPREGSPAEGPPDSYRRSLTGNPYSERLRVVDLRAAPSKIATPSGLPPPPGRRSQIAPPVTRGRVSAGGGSGGGASTARASLARNTNAACSPQQAQTKCNIRCSSVVREVERLKEQREQRRARQAEARLQKTALRRQDPGNPNWEVSVMLRKYRESINFSPLRSLDPNGAAVQQITVCVRKRPMSRRELKMKNVDIITVPTHDSLIVHEFRHKVDLTKFLEHHRFRFDYTFDEQCSNALVYDHTARPLIRTMFEGGNATCFAYGQTGSGKTHTMGGEFCGKVQDCRGGIYAMAARDVFEEVSRPEYRQMGAKITCSFFEIYGSKVFDLLHPEKPLLRVLEDGRQQVVVVGLTEMPVTKVEDVLRLIELGNRERTSGQTSANAKSSRSHAVFQMALHLPDSWGPFGKCSFVDLAGNERGADTQSADRQTRIEGAEINKSLLALKECIRALSRQCHHLPFRGSKLTQVLRDSFIGGKKNRTCMIAMISPALTCVENTLNTLRYADRVKELVACKDEDGQPGDGPDADDQGAGTPSEPEVSEEEQDFSHIPSLSSDPPRSYFAESTMGDLEFSHSMTQLENRRESVSHSTPNSVNLEQVADQHGSLVDYLEDFVRRFRGLETGDEFPAFLRTADEHLTEMSNMVAHTRELVLNYNAQQLIKAVMVEGGMELGPVDGQDEDEDDLDIEDEEEYELRM